MIQPDRVPAVKQPHIAVRQDLGGIGLRPPSGVGIEQELAQTAADPQSKRPLPVSISKNSGKSGNIVISQASAMMR